MLTNTICNNFTIINAYDTAVSAVDNNFYFPWAKECGITMPKEWINWTCKKRRDWLHMEKIVNKEVETQNLSIKTNFKY